MPTTLLLSRDSPVDTVLTTPDGTKEYEVTTTTKSPIVTQVKRTDDGVVVASWKWQNARGEQLTLGDAKPIAGDSWLQRKMIENEYVPFRIIAVIDTVDLLANTARLISKPPMGRRTFGNWAKRLDTTRYGVRYD